MSLRLLLISDIHGNYPALVAINKKLHCSSFDQIINCGDSLVYAPFPNQTLEWLQKHDVISILGNTDKKVLKILRGKSFKKPTKQDKRIMYSSTALALSKKNSHYLQHLPKSHTLHLSTEKDLHHQVDFKIGMFHGSPAAHHDFLFATTPDSTFEELAAQTKYDIIITGHSHTPYHKIISGVHFINPGAVGRMFDGDPRASCASLEIDNNKITVRHFRITYQISKTIKAIEEQNLPLIYCDMYVQGKKLN